MFDFLPDRVKPTALRSPDRLTPLLYAAGLITIGATLLAVKPRIGHVPSALLTKDGPKAGRRGRAARKGRDAVNSLAPTNVTDSIGRSLVVGGVALALTRLLDEAA